LAEEQKQRKDTTKRRRDETIRAREALEKRRHQQERDGISQEESSSEPDLDGEDFDIFSNKEEEQGFRGMVPPQGAPVGGAKASGELGAPRREGRGLAP
jgi:hypothetical protein